MNPVLVTYAGPTTMHVSVPLGKGHITLMLRSGENKVDAKLWHAFKASKGYPQHKNLLKEGAPAKAETKAPEPPAPPAEEPKAPEPPAEA